MMNVEALAASVWFVAGAYFAAFLPWTALTTTDFLSSKWVSVRETRRAGYRNLVYTFLPMVYVILFGVVHAKAGEFTEMCAAAVATMFAALVGSRTLWGLWQLHAFRTWAHHSIDAMRSMGIPYSLRGENGMDENDPDSGSVSDSSAIADEMLVNEKIADNQILHGDVQCYVKYGSRELLRMRKHGCDGKRYKHVGVRHVMELLGAAIDPVREAIGWMEFVAVIVFELLRSLLGTVAQRKCGEEKKGRMRQVPVDPVQVWVHWAATFASQGLQQWMREFEVAQDPNGRERKSGESAKDRFLKRGRYFGSQLLASAVLQLWKEGGGKGSSPFLWKHWNKDSGMSDGRFVKQEVLKEALEEGKCLPFEASHIASLRSRRDRRGNTYYSYDSYEEMLREFVSELPVQSTFVQEMRKFDVEKLEWLTILLHMGRIAEEVRGGDSGEGTRQTKKRDLSDDEGTRLGSESEIDTDGSDQSDYEGSRSESESESGDWDHDDEKAMEEDERRAGGMKNLWLQLGMSPSNEGGRGETKPWDAEEVLEVNGIPLMRHMMGRLSSANRFVCQVGELVDVWQSLVIGEQVGLLMERNEEWRKVCIGRRNDGVRDLYQSHENGDRSEEQKREDGWGMQQAHRELEIRRLDLRMGWSGFWGLNYVDECVTFMGYRMESVRTVLGRCVWEMGDRNDCELFADVSEDAMDDVVLNVDLGREMRDVLRDPDCMELLERRGVKCRLVWELQNAVEKQVMTVEGWENADGGEEFKKMEIGTRMLMVLSFPGVHVAVNGVEYEDVNEGTKSKDWCCIYLGMRVVERQCREEKKRISSISMKIEAICSPQKMWIEAGVKGNGECWLKLVSSDEEKFEWKWWRDAFLGRLEGRREWQESMGIAATELDCVHGVDDEERMVEFDKKEIGKLLIWREWPPFRVSICRLELDGKDVLQQFQKREFVDTGKEKGPLIIAANMNYGSLNVLEKRPVSYSEAKATVLRDSQAMVKELLRNGHACLVERDKERKTKQEGAYARSDMQHTADSDVDEEQGDWETATIVDSRNLGLGATVNESNHALVTTKRSSDKNEIEMEEVNCTDDGLDRSEESRENRLIGVGTEHHVRGEEESERVMRDRLKSFTNGDRSGSGVREILELVEGFFGSMLVYKGEEVRVKEGRESDVACVVMRVCQRLIEHCGDVETYTQRIGRLLITCAIVDVVPARQVMMLIQQHFLYCATPWSIGACLHTMFCIVEDNHCRKSQGEKEIDSSIASEGNRNYESDQYRAIVYGLEQVIAGWAWLEHENACDVRTSLFSKLYKLLFRKSKDIMCSVPSPNIKMGPEQAGFLSATAWIFARGLEGVISDSKRAVELYEKAIKDGCHVGAMNDLGSLLIHGAPGVATNASRSVKLYERAIEEGSDVKAMTNLALILEKGAPGVAANAARSVELYERAIEEGSHVGAMNNLGLLLSQGAPGVAANAARSVELYERAIEEGPDFQPILNLGLMLEKGAPRVAANAARAVELYERAIDSHDDARAMYQLGLLLEKGAQGVSADVERAKQLFERAAREGNHEGAKDRLRQLMSSGEAQQSAGNSVE